MSQQQQSQNNSSDSEYEKRTNDGWDSPLQRQRPLPSMAATARRHISSDPASYPASDPPTPAPPVAPSSTVTFGSRVVDEKLTAQEHEAINEMLLAHMLRRGFLEATPKMLDGFADSDYEDE